MSNETRLPGADAPWQSPLAFRGQQTKLTLDDEYRGEVVQRNDPARLGRLRVRVFGYNDGIAVQYLPWAYPHRDAINQGGDFFAPAVGELVRVRFVNGDVNYPEWLGGWWGNTSANQLETPSGKKLTHRGKREEFGTNAFGGERVTSGVLKMEEHNECKAENQPNNRVIRTHTGKAVEFDDRQGLEKVRLADNLGNHVWIDTEDGLVGAESLQSYNKDEKERRGFVFSLREQLFQLYTTRAGQDHFLLTLNDLNRYLDFQSSTGSRIRFQDTSDSESKYELWTVGGRHIVLDDASKRVLVRSPDSRYILIDDDSKRIEVSSGSTTVVIDDDAEMVAIQSSHNVQLQSEKQVRIKAGEEVVINGSRILLNSQVVQAVNYVNSGPQFQKPQEVQAAKTPKTLFSSENRAQLGGT